MKCTSETWCISCTLHVLRTVGKILAKSAYVARQCATGVSRIATEMLNFCKFSYVRLRLITPWPALYHIGQDKSR